jgi:hypothetical protein
LPGTDVASFDAMGLDLYEELNALLAALGEAEAPYAVAGAVALAIHGAPRATTDIDLLVPAGDLERVQGVARSRGFTVEAMPMRFADGMEMRRSSKIAGEDTLTLDLLLVDSNLEEVWRTRERVATDQGQVWVVSRQGLIRMKTWANREQDLADIRRLQELDR